MHRKSLAIAAAITAALPVAASAAETTTYTYDARGRLVKVVHSGSANNGVETTTTHDKAGNRKTQTTTTT